MHKEAHAELGLMYRIKTGYYSRSAVRHRHRHRHRRHRRHRRHCTTATTNIAAAAAATTPRTTKAIVSHVGVKAAIWVPIVSSLVVLGIAMLAAHVGGRVRSKYWGDDESD